MACSPPLRRKRRVADEGRVFQEKWELDYFCTMAHGKIHCLICNTVIATPKQYNLRRHYESMHRAFNDYQGPARLAMLQDLRHTKLVHSPPKPAPKKRGGGGRGDGGGGGGGASSVQLLEKTNVVSVTASYELSKLIAASGKSYSEGDFVKTCIVRSAEIICPEKVQAFRDISLTRNTVAERIGEMSADLREQLRKSADKVEYYSIAFDEMMAVGGAPQVAVFVRTCDRDFVVQEELLELIAVENNMFGLNVYRKIDEAVKECGLDYGKLVSVSTDGDRKNEQTAMWFGRNALHFRNIVYQQTLCSKTLQLDNVLSLVAKCVNFIRGERSECRQFDGLLEDVDQQFVDVPAAGESRWLSCHKGLRRFYLLRQEIVVFMAAKEQNVDELRRPAWIQDLAFTVDVSAHLDELFEKLHVRDRVIGQFYGHIRAAIERVAAWKAQLLNQSLEEFPKCCELRAADPQLSFVRYGKKLELLATEFRARLDGMSDMEKDFELYAAPCSFDVNRAGERLQMELVELQCDTALRDKFEEVGVPSFYSYLPEKYKELREFALRITAMFGSGFMCGQVLLVMKLIKASQRSRLTDEHLLSVIKVGTAQTIQPDIKAIVLRKRCQASNRNTRRAAK